MNGLNIRSITKLGLQVSLVILLAFPLLPLRVSVFTVIPFLVFAALSLYLSKNRAHSRQSIVLLLLFFAVPAIYLTELLVTDNVTFVWFEIQRKMGLAFIPAGVFMVHRAGVDIDVRRYINVLVASTTILVVYSSGSILINGLVPEYVSSGGIAFAFRKAVSGLVHIHPTYFGMLIGYSALVMINGLYRSEGFNKAFGIKAVVALILVCFLVLLAARMAFLSFVVAALILTLMRLKENKQQVSSRLFIHYHLCVADALCTYYV